MTQHATRILACLTDSADAQRVTRAAVLLARSQCAELFALYVEAPGAATRRPPQVAQQLSRNLRHAAGLGARVEVLSSRRIAETILQFARANCVGRIVVGAARRTGWRRIVEEDVVARLRAKAGAIEVVVADE